MVKFNVELKKFGKMGEKSGWTYFIISANIAQKLKPNNRRSFRVKGKLDNFSIKMKEIMPMGGGDFIMPVNALMRKGLRKKYGDKVIVQIEEDTSEYIFNSDFMICLDDEPNAKKFFKTLTGSHQRYFSKWIDSAKTDSTKTRRIAEAVNALAKNWGYPEMLRAKEK